jgi:hypothetical protein
MSQELLQVATLAIGIGFGPSALDMPATADQQSYAGLGEARRGVRAGGAPPEFGIHPLPLLFHGLVAAACTAQAHN